MKTNDDVKNTNEIRSLLSNQTGGFAAATARMIAIE
jgi:hypothetical protein